VITAFLLKSAVSHIPNTKGVHEMKSFLAIALSVLAGCTSAAGQSLWKPDRAHSKVDFSVQHMVISEVTGRFTDFDMTLKQGEEDFTGSEVEASIKAASVNTDNESRDKHLRSDDFLNAEKFPELKFKSASFEKAGENTYKVAGDLTIRDVTKPVVLDVTLGGRITDPRGNQRVGFKATTVIDRFEYGVKWSRSLEAGGLIAGKDVTITLHIELVKQ
jgi:polyisoprenoid-binding protein YceI